MHDAAIEQLDDRRAEVEPTCENTMTRVDPADSGGNGPASPLDWEDCCGAGPLGRGQMPE